MAPSSEGALGGIVRDLQRHLRNATSAIVLALIASCGGGGGEAGPQTTSGLLPAAPAPGAQLFADSSVLRPMRAGASWMYRGVDGGLSVPRVYYNTVSHEAVAGSAGVVESHTNLFKSGGGSVGLVPGGSGVRLIEGFSLGGGAPQVLDSFELRSPLRLNEQYTVLDVRITDSGIDVDGDGKPEIVDIAAYRQVMGMETLTLPYLASFQAVRVDFITVARVTLSSNNFVGPVVRIVQRTWYAEGIGVVRRDQEEPDSTVTPNGTRVISEELVYADLLGSGIGITPVKPANVRPNNPPAQAGEVVHTVAGSGLALDDRVVVIGSLNVPGVGLRALDLRGNVIANRQLVGAGTDYWRGQHRFVASGSNVLLVVEPQDSEDEPYRLVRFDADLNGTDLIGAALDLGPSDLSNGLERWVVAVAGGQDVVWVLWARHFDSTGQFELLLRGFDLSGMPVTPEHQLDSGGPFADWKMSANGNTMVASWRHLGVGARYAVVIGEQTAPRIGTLTSTPQLAAAGDLPLMPVATGGLPALIWSGSIEPPQAIEKNLHGVRIDATGTVLRSNGGALDSEVITAAWPGTGVIDTNTPMFSAGGSQGRLVAFTQGSINYQGASSASRMAYALFFEPASAPLAAAAQSARMVLPDPTTWEDMVVTGHVVLADRVLYLGVSMSPSGPERLLTRILWLK
jgi:hypothetical protein